MERAPTPHGEAETSGSTLMMQHMSGSTMMQLQASGSNLTLEKKTSTGIMPDEEDLQSVPDESKRPRRLRSRWACYCCGTWSAIGIVLLLVGIAALVGYLIGKCIGARLGPWGSPDLFVTPNFIRGAPCRQI